MFEGQSHTTSVTSIDLFKAHIAKSVIVSTVDLVADLPGLSFMSQM